MIDNEHCYVCDRPAKEGSHEHGYLVKLKNRPSSNTEKDKSFVVNDLKNFFGNIQNNSQPFYNRIPDVRNSIKLTREKEQDLKRQIDQIKAKLKSLRDQRKDIFVGGEDSETSDAQILSSYQGAIRRMQDARIKIDDILRPKIKNYRNQIKNIENEIRFSK